MRRVVVFQIRRLRVNLFGDGTRSIRSSFCPTLLPSSLIKQATPRLLHLNKEAHIVDGDGGYEHMTTIEALHPFDKMRQSNSTFYMSDFNQLLTGVVRSKHYRDAIAVHTKFRLNGPVLHFSTLNILMCCCSAGCTDQSLDVKCTDQSLDVKCIVSQDTVDNTVNKFAVLPEVKMANGTDLLEPKRKALHLVDPVLKVCSEQDRQKICRILQLCDDWYLVQEALEKCSIQLTPELVKEVLNASSRIGYIALCFFSWVAKQPGYSHTTETYNMAIKIAGGGKDFKHMRNLFYEMRRNGCLITSDTWTIMIMQYARSGLTEIALRFFKEMKDNGCKPTNSVYRYVIILLCNKKGRKVKEAIATFQQMLREGHAVDKGLAETYLECLCEENQLSDAKGCVETLHKVGYSIPLGYSLYIRALCRAGKLDEALKLLDEVKTDYSTLSQYTYGSIVHALLQKGRLADALIKVDCMRKAGTNPTVHVHTAFIVHYFKEKQVEKAVEMYEDMKRQGVQPTVVTYSALIRGYTETERINKAWDVFNTLKLSGPSPDFKTYSMFMHCLCKVGRSEEAFKLLSEMAGRGIVPSAVNFRTVYYGLNREGKHDVALSVLHQKAALKSKRQFT